MIKATTLALALAASPAMADDVDEMCTNLSVIAAGIADIGEKLDQAQTDFILKFMAPGDKVSDAIAKIVIDHHHMMQGLDYDVYQWLKIQAHNSGVTYAEMIAAILFDAYAEEHDD